MNLNSDLHIQSGSPLIGKGARGNREHRREQHILTVSNAKFFLMAMASLACNRIGFASDHPRRHKSHP